MKHSYYFLTKTFLATALLLQISCSWMGVRDPAAKKTAPAISYEDVFSIGTGNNTTTKDLKDQFIKSLAYKAEKISYATEISKDLPADVAFKVAFDVVDDQYIIKILHKKNSFKDTDALYELGHFLKKLNSGLQLKTNLSMFEMYYNASEGDPIALDNFLKIKKEESAYYNNIGLLTPADYLKRTEAAQEMRAELAPQIKELKLQRKILEEKRKSLMDKLDMAPEAKQFKALVAKGDRNGVADLLQKYLPFEKMAPFEKKFWETHLEIIRNPVPLDQRILIYRGLSDDFIHIAREGNKELDKDEAIKESKTFVMSTVLVKNQGSWNRRLRSLDAMNDKFIGTIDDSSEYSQSARISTMFLKHASDPKGSPFLSFTPDFGIAQSFGGSKMMSALIDPRLLHFNYASIFQNEIEFLLPLVTFPDEMVGLWHSNYHAGIDRRAFLEERLRIKITEEFGKGKAEEIIKRIKKNSADFFAPVFNNGEKGLKGVKGGTTASFYKKFAKAGDLKPAMTPQGNLTCKDLLKIFWEVP